MAVPSSRCSFLHVTWRSMDILLLVIPWMEVAAAVLPRCRVDVAKLRATLDSEQTWICTMRG
jgi:hypothetical protein